MSNLDVLGMCVRNMFKRKLRTFLTVSGVMVGTAAIVLMLSLGLATEAHHRNQMEAAEADMTMIEVWAPWVEGTIWHPDGTREVPEGTPILNDEAVEAFERLANVQLASPRMQGQLFLRSDPFYMVPWPVIGIRAEVMQYMGLEVAEGRTLMPGDRYHIVFGAFAEHQFERMDASWEERGNRAHQWHMDPADIPTWVDVMRASPMRIAYDQRFVWGSTDEPQDITLGIRPVRSFDVDVVGVLAPSGNSQTDRAIFIDVELFIHLNNERIRAEEDQQTEWQWMFTPIRRRPPEDYNEVMVRVTDMRYTSRVASEIRELGFETFYPGRHLNMLIEGQRQQQQLLAAIGAVSLIIAAIGIANTMIMAVYERTREIGIMKVIGAAIKDIRRLFLMESAMIGFFGGLFGVILSLIGSYVLNNFDVPFMQPPPLDEWMMGGAEAADTVSLVTAWLCGVALLFAGLIGLMSGYFPARRATKLSALAAIRSE